MPDLHQEREHLVLADRHMDEGERRVADQITRIMQVTQIGQDTAEAEKLLRLLEETLENWRVHQRLIVEAIARGETA